MLEFGLLYSDDNKCGRIGERTLYHLSLDSIFEAFCGESTDKKHYFLKILSMPQVSIDTIAYRREILRDFTVKRTLFSDLQRGVEQIMNIKRDFDDQKRERKRNMHNQDLAAASQNAKILLQISAETLGRTMIAIEQLRDRVASSGVRSAGLIKMKDELQRMVGLPEYRELIEFSSKFVYLSHTEPTNVKMTLSPSGLLEECHLIDPSYVHYTDPERKSKKSIFKRSSEEVYPTAVLQFQHHTIYEKLQSKPYHELTSAFELMCGSLFRTFAVLEQELSFYDVAMSYIGSLEAWGIPVCYPNFSMDGSISAEDFYDLLLLVDEEKRQGAVPNSFHLSGGVFGAILEGENSSGKTVYLRSLGCLWLIAQAGLPVPAKSANLTLKNAFYTQFSESEKEFTSGNEAGRFEQEVREVAEMLDGADDGSLILLNETFQTTSYDEAAAGLAPILRYLSAKNTHWLLVTHLRQLEGELDPDEVHYLTTSDGYRVLDAAINPQKVKDFF